MKRFLVILVIFHVVFGGSFAIRELRKGACEEVYVVRDGETLQSISERCNAPFILIDNPHVLDTDDVVPGTVLAVRSSKGNDVGMQYRSGIYFYTPEQEKAACESLEKQQQVSERLSPKFF